MRALSALLVCIVAIGARPASGQGQHTPDWTRQQLPTWVVRRLADSGFAERYRIATTLNPYFQAGDFDGDGRGDVAVLIIEQATGKQGVAIFRRASRTPDILGAGTTFGHGGDDFHWLGIWRIEPRGRIDDLYLEAPEAASAVVRWTGTRFTWLQRAD